MKQPRSATWSKLSGSIAAACTPPSVTSGGSFSPRSNAISEPSNSAIRVIGGNDPRRALEGMFAAIIERSSDFPISPRLSSYQHLA
jgi:hypothetical protein